MRGTGTWTCKPPVFSAATLAANVAHSLGHGPISAAVAAWPAVALVGNYELLMMIIRGAQQPAGDVSLGTRRTAAPQHHRERNQMS